MMDRHSSSERLSEFLEGELDAAARREIEAHLAACEACRGELAELRAVVEAAHALDDRPPAGDLWPGIQARLETARDVVRLERRRPAVRTDRGGRRFTFSLPQLAAAAITLALVSAGAVWLTFAPSGTPPADTIADSPAADRAADVRFASADFPGQEDYATAVADLERMLAREADRLDPATVATIERSLQVIDRAIDEAYAALADDPADPYLNHHLVSIRDRKLQLLRRAVDLARAET